MFVDPVAFKALQNILGEITTLIASRSLLPDTQSCCRELLEAATALTNDMVKRASRVQ